MSTAETPTCTARRELPSNITWSCKRPMGHAGAHCDWWTNDTWEDAHQSAGTSGHGPDGGPR